MHLGKVLVLVFIASGRETAQQSPQQEANVQCLERLRLPAYTGIAVSARLFGDVDTTVHIGRNGAVQDVAFAGKPHPLLANAVLDAIRASVFASSCESRTVVVQFKFRVDGKGTDYPTPPVLSFGFPNTFWIVSAPRNIQP